MTDLFPATLPIYDGLRRADGGPEWLETLPDLVRELADRWSLGLGEPFHGGSASWVAPATLPGHPPAVLKISWPHREAREEATALRLWDGAGACRIFREDRERYALLIERCVPGTPLTRVDLPAEERLTLAGRVLRQLWQAEPVPGFEAVADVTAEWARTATERMQRLRPPFDPGLVRHGIELLESLPATATRSVVVHGDFNPGNVLAAERSGWLAIDAKPMTGDPGYDPSPLLLQVDPPFEYADPAPILRRRFDLFADVLGEPASRLIAWAVARSVEAALWYVSRDDDGSPSMHEAKVLAGLIE